MVHLDAMEDMVFGMGKDGFIPNSQQQALFCYENMTMTVIPVNKDIVFRKWELSDAQDLAKHANSASRAQFTRNRFVFPYTIQDAQDFIQMLHNQTIEQQKSHINYAVYHIPSGECIGGISLDWQSDIHERNAEIGYWISHLHNGKGYATSCVDVFLKNVVPGHVKYHQKALHRIFAGIYAENVGSRRVLEKNGFVFDAMIRQSIYKNGRYHDEMLYSLLLNE
jgi:[ribosomal protein S5]-alanine N-acetyltransferase